MGELKRGRDETWEEFALKGGRARTETWEEIASNVAFGITDPLKNICFICFLILSTSNTLLKPKVIATKGNCNRRLLQPKVIATEGYCNRR